MKTAYQIYMSDIENIAPLSRKDEINHFINWKVNGDESSRSTIYAANLRFVVKVSHKYKYLGIDILDIINEGNIGLSTAMDRFDHTANIKFISFAVWYIRQSILELIAYQSRFVSITGTEGVLKQKLNKAGIKLMQKLHREPTDIELSEETGFAIDKVRHMQSMLKNDSSLSLDTPVNKHNTTNITIQDSIKDDKFVAPDDIDASINTDLILKTLKQVLSDKEFHVLKACFGINQEQRTLEDISIDYKVTKERIRQIREKALENLRAFSRKNKKLNIKNALDEVR